MGIVALTDIQDFVADVAREFLPEKVILFGSYAAGNAGEESARRELRALMAPNYTGVLCRQHY